MKINQMCSELAQMILVMLFAVEGFAAVSITDTTTTLTTIPNPSTYGQDVTVAATVVVLPSLGGTIGGGGVTGNNPPLTGTVTFMDGALVLGTSTFDNTGRATINLSSLAAGTHPITASYGGDANYAMSSSWTINQVVTASTAVHDFACVNPEKIQKNNVCYNITIKLKGVSNVKGGRTRKSH